MLRSAIVPLAAAGTAALVGLGASVKGTIDAADEMSKAAAKFGIPIEELSRLKYAADLSDVSLEGLGTSVGKLSKNMVSAATGAGPMAEAFRAAGIAVTNADGSLRSSSEVLSDLSDKFASMPDGAEKTALAMQLMGRSGAEMIPLLNGGSAALKQMGEEAGTFGQVFTAEMGTNAEAFNDNLTRLGGAFGNLSARLTSELLPYLAQFTDWLVASSPRIIEGTKNLVDFGAKVVSALSTIAPVLNAVSDGMHAVVQAATDAAAGIATFATKVSETINAAIGSIRQFGSDVAATLSALPGQMTEIGRQIIDGLLAGLREKWEAAKAWFVSLGDSIPQWVRNRLGIQSPSTVFAEIGRNIMQGLSGGLTSMQGGVESDVQGFASNLATTFADVLTGAQDFRSALSSILSQVGSSMLQAGIGNAFAAIGIPGFANGTRFAPGGMALVGERGPEYVNLPRGSQVIPNRDIGGARGDATINVNVTGANGDAHVMALVEQGVSRGLTLYDSTLPSRIGRISQDPRRR